MYGSNRFWKIHGNVNLAGLVKESSEGMAMERRRTERKAEAGREGKMTKALGADNSTEAIAQYIVGNLFEIDDTVYEIYRMQDTLKWLLVSYHKYHDLLRDAESFRRAMQILADGNQEKIDAAMKRARAEILEEWEPKKI